MKKIPLRKCLATNEQLPKKDLIRIVKDKDGIISIDESGRANGHGAYLKKSKEAVDIAKSKHLLDKALECQIPSTIYDQLYELCK